jgi:transmembrane sensor
MSGPIQLPFDFDLLRRHHAGEGSAAEAAVLEAWVAGNPSRRALLDAFHPFGTGPVPSEFDAAHGWSVIAQRLDARSNGDVLARSQIPAQRAMRPVPAFGWRRGAFTRSLYTGMRMSMAAVAVAAVAVLGIMMPRRTDRPSVASAQTYTTTTGQRLRVTLADGSRIVLAPRTQLRIDPVFGHETRTVVLTGQASFDVNASAGTPFRVQSGGVTAYVLGTSFSITHYAGDARVQVAVASGRIRTEMQGLSPVTLSQGMIASVSSSAIDTVRGDATAYSSWTEGKLQFRDASVPDVLRTLERWYGIQFRLADSALAAERITARLDFRSRREIMTALETLLGVRLTTETIGDTTIVTLRPSLAAPTATPRRPNTTPLTLHRELGR